MPLAPPAAPPPAPEKPVSTTAALSDAAASALTTPPGPTPKTPEAGKDASVKPAEKGKPAESYQGILMEIKDAFEKAGVANSPLASGFLALAGMLLKLGICLDFIPGHYEAKIKKNTEELSDAEKKAVKDALEKKARQEVSEAEKKKLADENKGLEGIERATTKYAAKVLWGLDNIDNSENLFAKLRNSKDNGNDLYETTTLQAMKTSGYPYGALITFANQATEGNKIVAFATGNQDEFEYFDLKKGAAVRFNANAPDSPVHEVAIYAMKPVGKPLDKNS